MSHKQCLIVVAGTLTLSLSAIAGVAAKDDNQQQLVSLPTPGIIQPSAAQSLNKRLVQHLCYAPNRTMVRCIYHDHYTPTAEADLAASEAEAVIPD